ncbi:hypothetical protein EYF80_043510 [Liparis tanakae]|uniref:Uncharacterized protein n=1 Tax=Liparis tanakae TaxID=230148 RepID=A0A4Z2G171_9TELE|nr:hypothetical protein EYF80_043510 [Liparis tanakae]
MSGCRCSHIGCHITRPLANRKVSGANRNTNSSTVAMLLWNSLVRACSSSSGREPPCCGPEPPRAEPEHEPGAPGDDPWLPTGWRKALLLLPPDQPWLRLGSWLHSCAASSSIQCSVWSSLVSATPSLSWWPVRRSEPVPVGQQDGGAVEDMRQGCLDQLPAGDALDGLRQGGRQTVELILHQHPLKGLGRQPEREGKETSAGN